MVLLDEFNIALRYRCVDVGKLIADLRARPAMQHVVATGRGAPSELIAAAETVSEMHPVRHAFASGIAAQESS
jgi:cob(I)alamin adenosyltransferase